jgi:quercetin dioxygenase-like cupin family protein
MVGAGAIAHTTTEVLMAIVNSGSARSLHKPDDHFSRGGAEIDVVQLGDLKVKRGTYPPGWRYSERMGAPICYDTHVGYALSGRLHVDLSDGSSFEIAPGDAFMIPAGHDAYTVGDEPFVLIQFDEGDSAASRFNLPGMAKAA